MPIEKRIVRFPFQAASGIRPVLVALGEIGRFRKKEIWQMRNRLDLSYTDINSALLHYSGSREGVRRGSTGGGGRLGSYPSEAGKMGKEGQWARRSRG